jgi:hypothetical protein
MADRKQDAEDPLASVLRMQAEAAEFLQEAIVAGKKQEALQWELELRKLNEMLTFYGADRPA